MTTADQKIEDAADKLQGLADRLAGEGGLKSKLAEPLADDADLLRKMKPSLIKARAKGEAAPAAKPPVRESGPVEGVRGKTRSVSSAERTGGGGLGEPGGSPSSNREVPPTGTRLSPSSPQLGSRPKPKKAGGPNPWLVVGVALAAGIFLAKWVDWRGHAHPGD